MRARLVGLAAFALGAFCFVESAAANAGEVATDAQGSTTWKAGVDGVEIEWNADGSVKRIYSRYSMPVEFADRRGIATAQIISEEKAKAGIIRFLDQTVSSTRTASEVEADLNTAVQQRQTGQAASVSKTDERKLVESLTEITTSFAAGELKGVIVLERGYDDKTDEAWVVVGISNKTLRAASGVQSMIKNGVPATDSNDTTGNSSEVRKSPQQDW